MEWSFYRHRKEDKMILGEKIIALRKRMNWSQEELAEKLDISRQSVSKWEVGATIPDLDKILKMSDIFGVSTDYLLKDEIEETGLSGGRDIPDGRTVSVEEANEFMRLSQEVSGKIALAVSLFILSPVILLQLFALTEGEKVWILEDWAAGVGVTGILLFVAAGVAICVYNGMKLEKFKYLESEQFSLQYGVEGIVEKRKADFAERFRRSVITGIVLCIIGAIPLLLAAAFSSDDVVMTGCLNIVLMFVAAGVHFIVRAGVVQESFNKLLQCEDYTLQNKEANRKLAYFPGSYWLVVTALFLGCGFYTENWGRTAVLIWPVAGVLFAAVYGILRAAVMRK